jgi:cation diffusion facilitator family transporter
MATSTNREQQLKSVRRVLWGVLVANVAITVIKIALGIVTGALVIVADGFHSLIDSSSNLIGLTAVRLATRPADEKYPYGYQRYETLGALAIGGLLMAAAWEIIQTVVDRIINGTQPEITWLSFGLVALTLPVNIGVVVFETRAGKRLNSEILLADAAHTKTDLYVTASVIASLIGIMLGWRWLDLLVATGVVGLIVRSSIRILRDAAGSLADAIRVNPDRIEEIALGVPGVRYVHNVRSRGTSDSVFVDLHVKVDPGMSTAQGHAIASEVERRVCSQDPNVVDAIVHLEPANFEESTDWERIAYRLRQIAYGMGLSLHDLNIHVNPEGELSIELDLEIQGDVTLLEAHQLADSFEKRALEYWPEALQITTHLEPVSDKLFFPVKEVDQTKYENIRNYLESIIEEDKLVELNFQLVEGRLGVVITLEMPSDIKLVESHNRVEDIKLNLLNSYPEVSRVLVHVEPMDSP